MILKKILKDNLKGELIVNGKNFTKHAYFAKGELLFATSDCEEDRLGEMLCSKGRITREQYLMLRKMREAGGDKFGKLLTRLKLLDKQDLFKELSDQVKEIALSFFDLTSGNWVFKSGTPRVPGNLKFNIPVKELIIDGIQEMTDFSYYKRKFTYRAPVTLPIDEELGKVINADDIRFYVKITRCATISTDEIISILDMKTDEFWRRLVLLYLLNAVDFTDFRIDSQVHQDMEAINELHEKLSANSLDHYQLLQLKNTASMIEVKDKYFSFTKKYAPQNIKASPDSQAFEKAEFVVEKAAQAFEILSDEEKKKAYDTGQRMRSKEATVSSGKKGTPVAPDKRDDIRSARHLYLKAHNLFEEKRFHEAAHMMEEAITLDKERSSYYMLLGLCQIRIPDLRPFAEKHLLKVAEMEPWNADPVFYLGELYWSEQLYNKAEKSFRKALEINMEHTLAAKMINKIENRLKKRSGMSLFGKR